VFSYFVVLLKIAIQKYQYIDICVIILICYKTQIETKVLKHNPGPWQICPVFCHEGNVDGMPIIIDNQGEEIAVITDTAANTEGNAKMLAAAFELFKLCQRLIELRNSAIDVFGMLTWTCGIAEQMEEIDRVITRLQQPQ